MLKLNMRHIYIDKDWVVQQYLSMEKDKEWDKLETTNDEKVAELELLWYATDRGIPVHELRLIDAQEEGNNDIQADDIRTEPVASVTKKPIDVHRSDSSNAERNGSTESDMSQNLSNLP
jgi:hypothetical protein